MTGVSVLFLATLSGNTYLGYRVWLLGINWLTCKLSIRPEWGRGGLGGEERKGDDRMAMGGME